MYCRQEGVNSFVGSEHIFEKINSRNSLEFSCKRRREWCAVEIDSEQQLFLRVESDIADVGLIEVWINRTEETFDAGFKLLPPQKRANRCPCVLVQRRTTASQKSVTDGFVVQSKAEIPVIPLS